METEKTGLFFLDSGAHTLYNKEARGKKRHGDYQFFSLKPGTKFRKYVDSYARFVTKHRQYIDYYANVDVIFSPEKSWEVLKYLEEEHGLKPMPVIHYNTGLEWVEKHIEAGYEFIGLGGLGQEATASAYRSWGDRVYDFLCSNPKRLPVVRTHGFAMTAYGLMIRWPWWLVDSATWTKVGAFGSITVPQKRKGQFVFDIAPWLIAVSQESPAAKVLDRHYTTLKEKEREYVDEWLELIGVPFGKMDGEEIIEYGVSNRHTERKIVNLIFFEKLMEWLPPWPWPFKSENRSIRSKQKGFFPVGVK